MPPSLPSSTGEAVAVEPEHPPEPDLTAGRVIPLRHPGRWIATVVVLVLLAQFVHGLVTNPFYQWDRFAYWFARPVVLQGLLITLEVTAISAVLALLAGIVLALMRRSHSPVLQTVSWAYIWLFRSVPLIVLLLFLYNFSALYKVLGLGVPFGPQVFSFGVTRLGTDLVIAIVGRLYQFRHIVLPQALRTIVPSYVNVLIDIVKGSSLVFYVSLLDLFGQVQSLGSTYPGDIVPLLIVATVWYVVLTSVISVVQYYVERRVARGAERTLPPTPLQRLRRALGSIRSIGAARFRSK